ncbi:hypothetical protein PCK2_000335 [Pneumocystis canis]|nr:hypothetical protein PCK2_000335 [Pneumocystis canis]
MYTIIETESNYKLGGKLLDDCLVEYFSKEFEKKYNLNPRNNMKAMAKLRAECETIKKSLSSSNVSMISIECMFGGLGKHVFNEMAALVENTLKKAQMENFDIDEVILAGGTSHIPKIAEIFTVIFPEKTLIRAQSLQTSTFSPSDIECYGAAIQASLISSLRKDELTDLINSDITCVPHLLNPIGVVIESCEETTFIPIINSYTAVPVEKSIIFDGPSYEGNLCIYISQGIACLVSNHTESLKTQISSDTDDSFVQEKSRMIQPSQKIAECILENLLPNTKIQVMIHIDLNLKMTVTAKSLLSTQNTLVEGEYYIYSLFIYFFQPIFNLSTKSSYFKIFYIWCLIVKMAQNGLPPGTTQVNGSNLFTTPLAHLGMILPPLDIREIVEKTANYVSRNGIVFEEKIREKEKNNAKFCFLNPADPYYSSLKILSSSDVITISILARRKNIHIIYTGS